MPTIDSSAVEDKCKLLFAPHTSTSHAPLYEIDYNMHKSNSTYLSDLDVGRSRLLLSLLRPGLTRLTKEHKKTCNIVLGGVSLNFRKAIPPLASYRMVSRVLCWDRKWLYIATEFREPGEGRKVVYATALARYVVKAGGRVTVPPEKLIEAAGLLSKEAEGRSERSLRFVQGFAAMDDLHGEFAAEE